MSALRAQAIIRPSPGISTPELPSFEMLMILIGSICRQGNSREKGALVTALRRNGNPSVSEPHVVGRPVSSPESDGHGAAVLQRNRPLEQEPAYYTLALKEHGDKCGVIPIYNCDQMAMNPPWFRATLSFNGDNFEASASTKKAAKHAVSRRAVERMRAA